jgi:hypothetical protein
VAAAIHLNAASAALPSAGVVAAVTAHLDIEGRIGSQAAFARAQDGLALARQRAATLFDCRPNQIAFGTTCEQLGIPCNNILRPHETPATFQRQ